jgi:hypothetical protein
VKVKNSKDHIMETKKISFGFNKVTKKTEIVSKASKASNSVELIDCLEDQSIKVKNAREKTDELLIIPIQGSSNKLLDQIKKATEKRIKTEADEEKEVPDSALSLDELAARELIREAKNRGIVKNETKVFSLPLTGDKFVAEGAEESSLEDYDSVPISDYGMAMLRGMNWKEGMPIGKRPSARTVPKVPELRPKGLGLGANKMISTSKPSQSTDKDGKELQLVKGAFVVIIAGNHKGHYCQVQGLDDENSRVIVKTAITNEVLNLNEFLIVPVTNEEYAKGSKIINNAKYEEYQEKSNHKIQKRDKSGDRDRSRSRSRSRHKKKESVRNDSHLESTKDRSRSREREKKKKKKSKKSKHDAHSSDSDNERRRKNKKKSKSKYKSSDSDSEREHRRKKDKETRR